MTTQSKAPEMPIKDAADVLMVRRTAARATPPWPEVFALLETVPDGGLESIPGGDQNLFCWKLMQLLAGTSKGYGSLLTVDVAHVLIGRKNRSTVDLYRAVWGVRRLQETTREELAELAKRCGLELD